MSYYPPGTVFGHWSPVTPTRGHFAARGDESRILTAPNQTIIVISVRKNAGGTWDARGAVHGLMSFVTIARTKREAKKAAQAWAVSRLHENV